MKFANNEFGQRITAQKGMRASEPGSGWPVQAKCGEHVQDHWARLPGGKPDPWSEPETEWHRTWKERLVPDDWQEYTFPGGAHRADAIGKGGIVVEFQHSSIDSATIRERETFYLQNAAAMVWVFDGAGWGFKQDPLTSAWEGSIPLLWHPPHPSLFDAGCPMFVDTGKGLFEFLSMDIDLDRLKAACPVKVATVGYKAFLARFGIAPGTPFEAPVAPEVPQVCPTWIEREEARQAAIEAQRAAAEAQKEREQAEREADSKARQEARDVAFRAAYEAEFNPAPGPCVPPPESLDRAILLERFDKARAYLQDDNTPRGMVPNQRDREEQRAEDLAALEARLATWIEWQDQWNAWKARRAA